MATAGKMQLPMLHAIVSRRRQAVPADQSTADRGQPQHNRTVLVPKQNFISPLWEHFGCQPKEKIEPVIC